MRAGILLIVLYWALFTIRAGLQPKVAAEDEKEPDENQTTAFDAEAAEDTE